jgi:hypothetical protein
VAHLYIHANLDSRAAGSHNVADNLSWFVKYGMEDSTPFSSIGCGSNQPKEFPEQECGTDELKIVFQVDHFDSNITSDDDAEDGRRASSDTGSTLSISEVVETPRKVSSESSDSCNDVSSNQPRWVFAALFIIQTC